MVLYMIWGAMAGPLFDQDAWMLARTAQGEAEVLGAVGMDCVMWVVHNRVQSPQFPNSIKEVVTNKGSFGGYWRVKIPRDDVYEQALEFLRLPKSELDDPTSGALFVFGKKDVKNYNLPPADWVLVNSEFELHFYEIIDWKAWQEGGGGKYFL